jgi:hypothetical protein
MIFAELPISLQHSIVFQVAKYLFCCTLNSWVPGSAFRVENRQTISCSGFQATITSEPFNLGVPFRTEKAETQGTYFSEHQIVWYRSKVFA